MTLGRSPAVGAFSLVLDGSLGGVAGGAGGSQSVRWQAGESAHRPGVGEAEFGTSGGGVEPPRAAICNSAIAFGIF